MNKTYEKPELMVFSCSTCVLKESTWTDGLFDFGTDDPYKGIWEELK